jgi:hypothetical protein
VLARVCGPTGRPGSDGRRGQGDREPSGAVTRTVVREQQGQQEPTPVKLFKALTDTATNPRGVRRPTTLSELCELTGATAADVADVIAASAGNRDRYLAREPRRACFLIGPFDEPLPHLTGWRFPANEVCRLGEAAVDPIPVPS